MPHYKDGTEAKVGDVVRGRQSSNGCLVVGVLVGITVGAQSCNLSIIPAVQVYENESGRVVVPVAAQSPWCFTASECERLC